MWLQYHLQSVKSTLGSTDATTLAVIVVYTSHFLVCYQDGGIGTVNPTEHAVIACLLVPYGTITAPTTGVVEHRIPWIVNYAAR